MINLWTQLAVLIGSIAVSIICRLIYTRLYHSNDTDLRVYTLLMMGNFAWLVTFVNIGYITYGFFSHRLLY